MLNSDEDMLFTELVRNSTVAAWQVSIADNYEDLNKYIYNVLKNNWSKYVVRSGHKIFDLIDVNGLAVKLEKELKCIIKLDEELSND